MPRKNIYLYPETNDVKKATNALLKIDELKKNQTKKSEKQIQKAEDELLKAFEHADMIAEKRNK